ncbi:hypothetical protein L9F63_024957 [Diploptera punctata]|uniref:E3 ubiquitin-protein ligase n=1 Tax=Diploptera punctata TaxID=6984 RepID=A0AAD8E6S4_DIPPU|nr:hypothetical protein L9F63_024957 [Diploptera punctata]
MDQNVEAENSGRVINLQECSTCHDTLAPPIYLCVNKHNICRRCKEGLSTCGICNDKILDERNTLAERLAEKLPYPCVNENVGCRQKLPLQELAIHEAVCPHRLYCCVPHQPRCRWRGRKFQILEHMKDEHKELVWIKSYNSLVYENFDIHTDHQCMHLLSCFKEIFWCHSKRDSKQGKLYEVLQYIGRREKAANYEYEFEFYSKGSNRTAVFKNTVQCENDDVEDIYSSGDCLVLDLKLLQHFITADKKLYYNLKLMKIPAHSCNISYSE